MKKYMPKILTFFIVMGVTCSCSFVSLDPQANDIDVSKDATSLKGCKFVGNTNVSLWSKAQTFQSNEKVENQLDILARNQAVTMNGNMVTPHSEIVNGQRTYSVYNCPPGSNMQK